jgi:p21-activated kinase 1
MWLLIRVDELLFTSTGATISPVINQTSQSTSSTLPARYQGWVESAISPLTEYIDKTINPRDYYLDLREISDGPGGTILYVARLADSRFDDLALPTHVEERDQRMAFVAIKSVPILPSGGTKLNEILRELTIMRGIHCENILSMDALYVDPVEDTLWVRMELMTRSLSSIIELSRVGLALSDRLIAGCTKDVRDILLPQSPPWDLILRPDYLCP